MRRYTWFGSRVSPSLRPARRRSKEPDNSKKLEVDIRRLTRERPAPRRLEYERKDVRPHGGNLKSPHNGAQARAIVLLPQGRVFRLPLRGGEKRAAAMACA